MLENILFEEIRDSMARAIARVKALNPIYETTATDRVVSFIGARGLEAEIKWYDDPDPECCVEDKSLWIKAVVGGYDVIIRTYHVNEKFLIDIRRVTNPETPLEIACTLDGVPTIWYHNIAREDIPGEVCKFLDDILEVI